MESILEAAHGVGAAQLLATRLAEAMRLAPPYPCKGGGFLAGEYPDGITNIDGVPASALVRVLYRPASGALGDGIVVATTISAPDGTWRIDGLNTSLKYDVVARYDGYNDTIMANITPDTD